MALENEAVLLEILSAPIGTKAEVIRFLVEIRKGIEFTASGFQALKFFCDWLVHSHLTQTKAMHVLSQLDLIADYRSRKQPIPPEELRKIGPVISFSKLRDELIYFLGEQRLPTKIATELPEWGTFLGTYLDLASLTPLRYTGSKVALKHIDNVRVRKLMTPKESDTPKPDEHFMFGVEWNLRKGDNTLLQISNTIYFPEAPQRREQPVAEKVTIDGTEYLVKLNRDSNVLWEDPAEPRSRNVFAVEPLKRDER